jgi:hypothetical protein
LSASTEAFGLLMVGGGQPVAACVTVFFVLGERHEFEFGSLAHPSPRVYTWRRDACVRGFADDG